MEANVPAMPVKPRKAAMTARIKKVTIQFSMNASVIWSASRVSRLFV
jgi:hypothetical protein